MDTGSIAALGSRLAHGPKRSRQLLVALTEAYMETHDCTWHEARYATDEDYRVECDEKRRRARLRDRAGELARAIRTGTWTPGSHVRIVPPLYDQDRGS